MNLEKSYRERNRDSESVEKESGCRVIEKLGLVTFGIRFVIWELEERKKMAKSKNMTG